MTAPTPRLTPEQAERADRFGLDVPTLLTTETERELSGRILDLLDERAALREQVAQAKAAVDSSQAGICGVRIALGIDPAAQALDDRGLIAVAPIMDACAALAARLEQAERDRDVLAHSLRSAIKVLTITKVDAILGHAASAALSRSKEQA